MLALGALLLCAAILALAASAILFRRPDPPRWTTRAWAGEVISIAIVAMLALGLAYLFTGAAGAYQEGPAVVDLGLLAVVLVAAVALWRKLALGVRMRATAVEPATRRQAAGGVAASRGATPLPEMPATSEPPPSRPRPRAA